MAKNRTMQQKNLTNRKRCMKISREKRFDIMCQEYKYPEYLETKSRIKSTIFIKNGESYYAVKGMSKGTNYKGISMLTTKQNYEQKKVEHKNYDTWEGLCHAENDDGIVFCFN